MTLLISIASLFASLLYALGSFQIKRSLKLGAGPKHALKATNLFMALWALPLLFLPRGDFELRDIALTLCAGAALFIGRYLAILALDKGELSIVGPLLGLKLLLIAAVATSTGQITVGPLHWVSVILATIGIAMVQARPRSEKKISKRAVFFALLASFFFAATDLIVVEVRQSMGSTLVTALLFFTVAALVPSLGKVDPPPAETKKQLWTGSAIIGFQTILIVFMIALTGEAIVINIIYASRSLWTVFADRWTGHFTTHGQAFKTRIVGALCITMAVITIAVAMDLHSPAKSTSVESLSHPVNCKCCAGAYPL